MTYWGHTTSAPCATTISSAKRLDGFGLPSLRYLDYEGGLGAQRLASLRHTARVKVLELQSGHLDEKRDGVRLDCKREGEGNGEVKEAKRVASSG